MLLSGLTYKNKIRLLFIPVFLLIGIGLLVTYEISVSSLRGEHHERLVRTSVLSDNNLNLTQKEMSRFVKLFQTNRTLIEYLYISTVLGGDIKPLKEVILPIYNSLGVDTIHLYDTSGRKVLDIDANASDDRLKTRLSSTYPDIRSGFKSHNGKVSIVAIGPLMGDNRTIGYISVGKYINNEYLKLLGNMSGNELFLVRKDLVLASSLKGSAVPQHIHEDKLNIGGQQYSIQKRTVQGMDGEELGTLYVALSDSKLLDDIFRLKSAMLLLFAAAVAVFLGLSVLFNRALVDPMNRIVGFVGGVSQGDFEQQLDVEGRDEIAVLSNHLNDMQLQLRANRQLAEQYTTNLETAVHERTAELEKVQKQLLQSQKMEAIGQLAGGVAHDFNNLLSIIMGYGEMAHDSVGAQSPIKEFLNQILAATEKAATLVDNLLAFSRDQAIDLKKVNVNEIVEHMQGMLRRIIPEDIILETSLDARPLIVQADHGQMEQLLLNMITNARDAMPAGGDIRISTCLTSIDESLSTDLSPGDYVQMNISDTGVGMNEKMRERIFEPFFTTKEVGKGTGLGLAIVYGILKKHGGYIHVYSELGKGTEFKIYLPYIKTDSEGQSEAEVAYPMGGSETILLVEDDKVLGRMLTGILLDAGYTVLNAENGAEAVEIFEKNPDRIHLVISDMIMPVMNGKEAVRLIKGIRQDVKTIFMSGYTADYLDKRDISSEGFYFISKPVRPREMLATIREVLG